MPLDGLQQHLAENRQWLPIRPQLARRGYTIGSLTALGASGPERWFYGAPRDFLLGLRFIDARGRLITSGGRVVKNVAGYDMTRLIAASRGTLGFITDATFRTAAVPEECLAVTASGPLAACAAAATALARSPLEPVFLVALSARLAGVTDTAGGAPDWRMCIGLEGFAKTIAYQLARISTLLREHGLTAVAEGAYTVQTGFFPPHYARLDQHPFLLRTDVPLDRTRGFQEELDRGTPAEEYLVDFGCGRILSGWDDITASDWAAICDLSVRHAGNLMLEKAPVAFKEEWDVFGPDRPEWEITHRIKKALDPLSVFSPGRLPGRI